MPDRIVTRDQVRREKLRAVRDALQEQQAHDQDLEQMEFLVIGNRLVVRKREKLPF